MNSQLSIINSALSRMGANPISDMDEGTSTAILMGNVYNHAREYVLRLHPWSCCRKRELISPVAETPKFGYSNAFPLPKDCLRIISVNAENWEVEGRYILADSNQLQLTYVWNSTKEQEWDSTLVEAFVLHLVSETCKEITGSSAAGEVAAVKLQTVLQQAKTLNGMERPSQNFQDGYVSELVWSRF